MDIDGDKTRVKPRVVSVDSVTRVPRFGASATVYRRHRLISENWARTCWELGETFCPADVVQFRAGGEHGTPRGACS